MTISFKIDMPITAEINGVTYWGYCTGINPCLIEMEYYHGVREGYKRKVFPIRVVKIWQRRELR